MERYHVPFHDQEDQDGDVLKCLFSQVIQVLFLFQMNDLGFKTFPK